MFDFANKNFSNNYAGGVAVEAVATMTIALIVIYTLTFLIAAFRTKNWKRYLLFISILFVPVVIVLIKVFFSTNAPNRG